MSAVTGRVITIVRHEFEVQTPCTWKDVNDAINMALSSWNDTHDGKPDNIHDDTAMVRIGDDRIVVWWEEIKRA